MWKFVVLLLCVFFLCVSGGRSRKLSLWIDEKQVSTFLGKNTGGSIRIYIIQDGVVVPYLLMPGIEDNIPVLPPEVNTVNLTWRAGDEMFTYWFDELKSNNHHVLFHPLLSIPVSGLIPAKESVFQMAIPCTGDRRGISTLVLGLKIYDHYGNPIQGSPIKLKLKKQCQAFATTILCGNKCKNGGRCNSFGDCECSHAFYGKHCEIAMCYPSCMNNGTCISPNECACADGFAGKLCQITLCAARCQNGGHCVGQGLCWCTSGFYGETCQFSHCQRDCENGGVCIGTDKCRCPRGYTGDFCESGLRRSLVVPDSACRKPCGHGECEPIERICVCARGWRGRYCHKKLKRVRRDRRRRKGRKRRRWMKKRTKKDKGSNKRKRKYPTFRKLEKQRKRKQRHRVPRHRLTV